jgi:hypothetical protein
MNALKAQLWHDYMIAQFHVSDITKSKKQKIMMTHKKKNTNLQTPKTPTT